MQQDQLKVVLALLELTVTCGKDCCAPDLVENQVNRSVANAARCLASEHVDPDCIDALVN